MYSYLQENQYGETKLIERAREGTLDEVKILLSQVSLIYYDYFMYSILDSVHTYCWANYRYMTGAPHLKKFFLRGILVSDFKCF